MELSRNSTICTLIKSYYQANRTLYSKSYVSIFNVTLAAWYHNTSAAPRADQRGRLLAPAHRAPVNKQRRVKARLTADQRSAYTYDWMGLKP